MCPMHLQSLKLPRPTVLKKMRFQKYYLTFDIGPTKCCPVAYIQLQRLNGSGGDAFTQKILYLTFVNDHKVLPSILYIIWFMQLQSLQRFRRRYTTKKSHA